MNIVHARLFTSTISNIHVDFRSVDESYESKTTLLYDIFCGWKYLHIGLDSCIVLFIACNVYCHSDIRLLPLLFAFAMAFAVASLCGLFVASTAA